MPRPPKIGFTWYLPDQGQEEFALDLARLIVDRTGRPVVVRVADWQCFAEPRMNWLDFGANEARSPCITALPSWLTSVTESPVAAPACYMW